MNYGRGVPRTNDPGRSVSSRLLAVLFSFRPERPMLSLAEVARTTGLPHATARRMLLELAAVGAVERHDDGRFGVGVRLWQLGTLAPLTESLRTHAQPFMEDLYTALRQHVQLAVLDGDEAVIVDRLSAPGALDLVSQVGGRLPLHCSGVGKVLLAHAGPVFTEALLSRPLPRYTPRTVVDPRALHRELAACRRTGSAIVRGELTEQADSVATRIIDGTGQVVAALSVVVRAESVTLPAALPPVIASGLGISRRLGWRPARRS